VAFGFGGNNVNSFWLHKAIRNVESNLGSLVDDTSTQEDIREEVFTLAWDAAVDAGANENEASAIANYVREQMSIHL
jgi:hypothetical protein